ncbi:unnamed protein product [Nyctereutes procyonoides]|uniref:(raccoon dog) hypothetical protein n=1 Tax=Nyctereutes procyonoides TaxID=34880 RepID=A0A811YMI2_NYCPR|nr:unnamed protein product [Nyctereutes procyonoides]
MQKAKIDTLQLELGARPQRLGSSKAQSCSQGEHRPSPEGQQNREAETAELRSFALTGSFAVNLGGGRRGPGSIPAAGRARQPGGQRRGHPAGAADHERPPGRHSEGAHPAGLDPGASAAAPAGGPRCRLSNRAVAAPAAPRRSGAPGPGPPPRLPPAAPQSPQKRGERNPWPRVTVLCSAL